MIGSRRKKFYFLNCCKINGVRRRRRRRHLKGNLLGKRRKSKNCGVKERELKRARFSIPVDMLLILLSASKSTNQFRALLPVADAASAATTAVVHYRGFAA
jgi:hypothetical protein